jgi:hypothetical protein
MELGRCEALGLASVMSRALAVVHGLFLRAVSHAFSFGIRGSVLDEGRVKPASKRPGTTISLMPKTPSQPNATPAPKLPPPSKVPHVYVERGLGNGVEKK